MKSKYDTVAICNALMDIEIKLSEEEFQKLSYPKSSMNLVDVEVSYALLDRFKNKPKSYSSGGSVGNTVYALAKMGLRAAVIANVGRDDFGKKYRQSYQKVGVDFLGRELDRPTGVCLVFITPDTARTMVTTLGCASDFTEDFLKQVYSLPSRSVYLESYLLAGDDNINLLTRMVNRIKKQGKLPKVILSDSDWFGVLRAPKAYPRLFRQVDIFFTNADQLRAMNGYQHQDDMDVKKYFLRGAGLKSRPNLWVVTDGEHGAYLSRVDRGKIRNVHIPARKVKVVDSNGAGDGFAAGVLAEYFNGASITKMGERGNEVASRIITRFGARYP